jgi:hypothetical protein
MTGPAPAPAASTAVASADDEPPPPPGRVARAVAEARARGRHPELAAFLAFLIPGLGHLYLGRKVKGLVAFVALVGLYVAGVVISGGECVSLDKQNGHYVAIFGQVGAGLPTGIALLSAHRYDVKKALGMEAGEPPEDPTDQPSRPEFVAMLPRFDTGLLYTTIAGLLNLLLIYDALLGSPGAALRREEDAK